jgi:hypothetical protein
MDNNHIKSSKMSSAVKKVMSQEEKQYRALQRLIAPKERNIAWGCFDEVILSKESFLKRLCTMYEEWAYDIVCANEDENALFPTPKEWIANNEAMLQIKNEKFHHSYSIKNNEAHRIEVGIVGYINALDDKTIQKKAKAVIFEWQKGRRFGDKIDAKKHADEYWVMLQNGHTTGAQIIKELRANKKRLIELFSSI